MLEIRDDIPAPKVENRCKWPFKDMKAGQSVKVEFDRDWQRAKIAASALGKRKGWKFTTKWHRDAEPAYGLIWRVL